MASLFSQRSLFPLSCHDWIPLSQPVLSAHFLKEMSNEIVQTLIVLYNEELLQTSVIPLEWKRFHITPVHKGGSMDDATNYRPIAVISVVVKFLEKLVV